jgi:hypothetical protein
MLEAKPISIFSRDFRIEAEGRQIALLDVAFWREAGEVSIEGRPYELYREGLMSGDFVLESEGQTLARAIKPSAWFSEFDLEIKGRRYLLKRHFIFGKSFSVLQDDAVVGSVVRAGLFSRRSIISLPPDWSIPAQVFVFWLVLVIWKRDDSSA